MIEEEIAFVGRFEIGKASSDPARAFRVLVGIGSVELGASCDARRVRGGFPAADAGAINGEREENIGIPEDVVVKEIPRAGAEVGNVKRPARQRDGQTKFMLLVALAAQREKTETLLCCLFQQRAVHCKQRRGLIVASVESAQHPVQPRNAEGGADSRIHRILADGRTEMREPHSAVDASANW